jgi:hypothetical protein
MTSADVETRDLLNAQTAEIEWRELVRHFARGVVVCVEPDEDLVVIADHLVNDRVEEIRALYEKERMHRATDEEAGRWENDNTRFWTVVVSPWVLVQEARTGPSQQS